MKRIFRVFLLTVVVTFGFGIGCVLVVALMEDRLGGLDKQPPPGTDISPKLTTYSVEELFRETNKHRAAPLMLDPVLDGTALKKCRLLSTSNDFNHGDLEPIRAELNRTVFGENLAKGYSSAKGVVDAWVQSPTHYENLVDERYRKVGFAVCSSRDGQIVVQHFSD